MKSIFNKILFISLLMNIHFCFSANKKDKNQLDTLYYNKSIDINNYSFIFQCKEKLNFITDSIIYKRPFSLIIIDGIPLNNNHRDSATGYFSRQCAGYIKEDLSPFQISEVYLSKTTIPHDKPYLIIKTNVHVFGYDTLYIDREPNNITTQYLEAKAKKINPIKNQFIQNPFPIIEYDGIDISDSITTDSTKVWDVHCECYFHPINRLYNDFYIEDISSILFVKNYMNSSKNLVVINSIKSRQILIPEKKRKQKK